MNDRLDDLLKQLAGNPQPTDADRTESRTRLGQLIAEDRGRGRRHAKQFRFVLAAGVSLLVLVVVAVQIARPSPAVAALTEFARAAEKTDTIEIPAGSFLYTVSEASVLGTVPADAFAARERPLAYLISTSREVWVGADGTVQIRTTTESPSFFSTQDESDYYGAGLDEIDQVGRTVTETFTDVASVYGEQAWPTDSDELRAAIIASSGAPDDGDIAQYALGVIVETPAPPELRAAVFKLLSELSGIRLLRSGDSTIFEIDSDLETLRFSVRPEGSLAEREMISNDGNQSLGIPANTTIESVRYSPPVVVSSSATGLDL